MIAAWIRKTELKDGCVRWRITTKVTHDETLNPLHVVAQNVPDRLKGFRRVGERVRVSRSGEWAIWTCEDRPK